MVVSSSNNNHAVRNHDTSDGPSSVIESLRRSGRQEIFVGAIVALSLLLVTRLGTTHLSQSPVATVRSTSSTTHAYLATDADDTVATPPDDGPGLAWLMTFPNSGTSYTLALVATATQTFYASNYGQEQQILIPGTRNIPIYPQTHPHGPFWVYNTSLIEQRQRTFPTELVLTKTHCGGRCLGCHPRRYIESTYSFRRRCAETQERIVLDDADPDHLRISHYPPTQVVQRIVHIVRNPWNNVVARFHHEAHEGRLDTETFQNARKGFRDYCLTVVNPKQTQNENDSPILEQSLLDLVRDIPCYSDFFKFAEWHNQALWTRHDLAVPSMTLFYEDYEHRHAAVLQELLDFLRLPRHPDAEIADFTAGHAYYDYYTLEERSRLKVLMRQLASRSTWKLLERYMGDVPDPPGWNTQNATHMGWQRRRRRRRQ